MATNTVNGNLVCSDGTNIPLKAEIAEGTESDLGTDSAFTVSSMAVGDFAPGKTVVSGIVLADNICSYAYILRQGLVAAIIPIAKKGFSNFQDALCAPIRLQAGDKVRVMTNSNSDREASLCVYTSSGQSRIFVVTPTGAATNELLDLQTSNSIGDTLQGQRIIKAFAQSVDGTKVETPGVVVVDNLGNVVGSVGFADIQGQQPQFTGKSIPIALNYKAEFLTNA